jgi:hypothetical protein
MALPETLQANVSGQFEHDGRYFIRIDGHLYEQRLDPQLKRWRIVHPQNNDAYQPLLEHNGDGAWHAEHEQPQDWGLVHLIRRLGPEFTGFTDDELRRATQVCGLSEDACARFTCDPGPPRRCWPIPLHACVPSSRPGPDGAGRHPRPRATVRGLLQPNQPS